MKRAKSLVLSVRSVLDGVLIRVCSSNRLFASLYYLLFSRSFHREYVGVLKGRLKFRKKIDQMSSPALRRNIHRLEKGLVMIPRRPVFAEGFILQTVRELERCVKRPRFSAPEIKWANDVLREYFFSVRDTSVISSARIIFESLQPAVSKLALHDEGQDGLSKPYPHSALVERKITFEDLSGLIARRRSVRWFTEQRVNMSDIKKAVDLAASAPSACNRLPYRFLASVDPDFSSRIAKCASGTAGFSEGIPAILIVVGDLSSYPEDRDRHVIYIDASLASMQLMLVLETLGLSTCPINWPEVEWTHRRLEELVELQDYERVVMLIAVGYPNPAGGIPFSQKKRSDLLLEERTSVR